MKLEFVMPLMFFLVITSLSTINATIGVIGGLLSIYYTSIKIYEHFKESKKNKSIFKK